MKLPRALSWLAHRGPACDAALEPAPYAGVLIAHRGIPEPGDRVVRIDRQAPAIRLLRDIAAAPAPSVLELAHFAVRRRRVLAVRLYRGEQPTIAGTHIGLRLHDDAIEIHQSSRVVRHLTTSRGVPRRYFQVPSGRGRFAATFAEASWTVEVGDTSVQRLIAALDAMLHGGAQTIAMRELAAGDVASLAPSLRLGIGHLTLFLQRADFATTAAMREAETAAKESIERTLETLLPAVVHALAPAGRTVPASLRFELTLDAQGRVSRIAGRRDAHWVATSDLGPAVDALILESRFPVGQPMRVLGSFFRIPED